MKLRFFCPLWGSAHLPFEKFCQNVRDAGYDGVEMPLPENQSEKEKLLSTLQEFELLLIAQHWETATNNFAAHKREYERRLRNLVTGQTIFINSQTGKDYFTLEQNGELFAIAENVARETGITILHETHRGKFSFAAHVTKTYLEKFPMLRLTVDFSHWCNTAESFLEDQVKALELAISRADHIHARVGFPEGPQVMDPRAPEWQEALNIHLGWWKKIAATRHAEGADMLTIAPEFGPEPYMPLLPFTKQPVTSQWDVNVFMMELLRAELAEWVD